jgi:hypothetical protein
VMHAGVVLGELIRGNAVWLHVLRVGVAARACLSDIDRVDCGLGIFRRPYIVDTMAIDAYRNFRVSRRKEFSVHTGVVLVQLVRA